MWTKQVMRKFYRKELEVIHLLLSRLLEEEEEEDAVPATQPPV